MLDNEDYAGNRYVPSITTGGSLPYGASFNRPYAAPCPSCGTCPTCGRAPNIYRDPRDHFYGPAGLPEQHRQPAIDKEAFDRAMSAFIIQRKKDLEVSPEVPVES